jgi:ABC-type amino acid transport substrate-binding protein
MRIARSFVTWGMVVGLVMSVWGQAVGAGESPKVSPVLDRIMAKKEVTVGTAASMPPLNMTTKGGEIIGMEMDLARSFANAMDVKLTLSRMHFNELLPALEKGKIDMILSGMTMTPQRNLKVAFVGPYFASGKSILTKKKNVESVDELSKMNQPDKVLVALKGSTSQMFVEKLIPKAKLVLADNYDQAVASVRSDMAVAMVADYPICVVSVHRYPDAWHCLPTIPCWSTGSRILLTSSRRVERLRVSCRGGSRILRGSVSCPEEFTRAFAEATSTTRSI